MGIMLYEFLYGKTPWDAENQYGLLQNIKKNGLTFPDIPIRSEKIKELISCMLKLTEKVSINLNF
jgi:serine/threonine-protein kinase ULK/ATG1